MRATVITLLLLLALGGVQAQNVSSSEKQKQQIDKMVSQMQNYFMVILTKGPNQNQESAELEKLKNEHLANMMKMANMGKLVLAGPFMENGNMRGIFIFDVETEAEVKQLADTDPMVKSGRMNYEVHPWFGPKALKELNKIYRNNLEEGKK
ncbi:MAG: hypothetical protein HXX14_11770 [Bacteroidetes bacterium]|nr:hypothetical protein [Bacteroidota bacterium]